MRYRLTMKPGWERLIWLWVVVLLTLPNCRFEVGGLGPLDNFTGGATPRTSAIFCDIESHTVARRCATAADLSAGVPLEQAAIALNRRQTNNIGLDFSDAARTALGCGATPVAITFEGAFPEGTAACLNCGGVIGPVFATVTDACVARCEDFFGTTGSEGGFTPTNPPDPATVTFCTAHAHPSTNAPGCFDNVCTDAGAKRPEFDDPAHLDPRRVPAPVVWTDTIGTTPVGNNLSKSSATAGPPAFDAGAASMQWVTHGDAYVEFSPNENNRSHVVGFSQIPGGCAFPCSDADPGLADISFGISLAATGQFGIFESGTPVPGPGPGGVWGTYNAGDRFRVTLHSNSDGTASVAYSQITGPCSPGVPCPETTFHTNAGSPATYPLRVDASFREQNDTILDVRIVRIQ